MNDIQEPESSGEARPPESGWQPPYGNGGWTPPPPPPDWGAPGWRDPGGPPPAAPPPPAWGNPAPYYWQPQGQTGWGGPGGPQDPGGPAGPGGWYGWSPAPARPRRSLPSTVTALLLVVAVLVGLGIGHGVWNSAHNTSANSPQAGNGGSSFNPFGNGSGPGNGGSNSGNSASLTAPVAAAANALVDIDTTLSYQGGAAAGTGIVLSSDGYILTNNHVISGATSIDATDVNNGQKYTATVVGYDRTHDVAVIKLSGASGLKTASIGDSAKVTQGETVVGLGNAGGAGGTPSSAPGQVTALNQSIKAQDESNNTTEQLTGLIETNSDIQPGDSGGALVDTSGRVIGMDTAASTGFSFETQGNQGFAIPINQAMAIAGDIRGGKGSSTVHIGATAFLGVEIDPNGGRLSGAAVSQAISGGAADQAGITSGSVITSLGGATVDSSSTLTNLISRYHPGDKVQIGWTDANGQTHTATVTFANGPAA
jgi:S1-C subfamily serine protease